MSSVSSARDHLNSFYIDGIKSDLYAGGVFWNRPAAIKKASIQSYIAKKKSYGLVELTFDFSILHMHLVQDKPNWDKRGMLSSTDNNKTIESNIWIFILNS